MSTPLIVAHRGDSVHAPENTLAAFRAASDAGADGIELDVQITRDGVPIVFHDYDLKRIGFKNARVLDLTAAELAEVDVGKWFANKTGNSTFAGEGIPTLAAVLDTLRGHEGRIYIELKADEGEVSRLASAVCDTIRDSPLLPQMIVKSFRLGVLPEVKRHLPDVRTAALFAPKIMDYLRRKRYIVALAREFGADELSLHRSLATKRLCSLAAEAGMPVTIWTADSTRWIDRARTRGIHAIITNDPMKMLAARSS